VVRRRVPEGNKEGKRVAVLTPEGVQRIGARACRNSEHTVVSRREAQLYGLEKKKLQRPLGIVGPSGVLVCVEDDYEALFLLGGPHGRRLKITAHGVDALEEYCGVPENSLWEWEMQLGKEDAKTLPLLQTVRPGDSQWDEMTLEEVRLSSTMASGSTWKLLVCKAQQEKAWLSVMWAWSMPVSRISTDAVARLGHVAQPNQGYPVRPRGALGYQEGLFLAKNASTLEITPSEGMMMTWPR
jgi:hypothetical protein